MNPDGRQMSRHLLLVTCVLLLLLLLGRWCSCSRLCCCCCCCCCCNGFPGDKCLMTTRVTSVQLSSIRTEILSSYKLRLFFRLLRPWKYVAWRSERRDRREERERAPTPIESSSSLRTKQQQVTNQQMQQTVLQRKTLLNVIHISSPGPLHAKRHEASTGATRQIISACDANISPNRCTGQ